MFTGVRTMRMTLKGPLSATALQIGDGAALPLPRVWGLPGLASL